MSYKRSILIGILLIFIVLMISAVTFYLSLGCGPGYATPLDAFHKGAREKLLYVVCVQPNLSEPHGDYLSTVDVDPTSSTYCKVIHRTFTNKTGNELHHSGWNTCSSCHKIDDTTTAEKIPKRDKLILPSLNSNNIYVLDVGTNPREPAIYKEIDSKVFADNNVSAPHATHCLANGNIMISTMGDRNDEAKGDFILFNSEFDCIGTWTKGDVFAKCGYDFWYQPKFDVMVSTEWSAPKYFKKYRGFNPFDKTENEEYGRCLNFYKWSEQKLIQTIDLGDEGMAPLEVRFVHNPNEAHGYVGSAVQSNLYHFWKEENSDKFQVEKCVDIPAVPVSNWVLPEISGILGDIIISLDDKYLYTSNFLQGDVRQYDISDRFRPVLKGQIYLGGLTVSDSGVEPKDIEEKHYPVVLKGKRLEGGPQMMQLSLDGKRLYVSSSLYSPWDKQFYPQAVKAGGYIVLLDVDLEHGGLTLNEDFMVDFGAEPHGPVLAHEMRYPGGDCTSDIWLADE